jgi:hypothetical protein
MSLRHAILLTALLPVLGSSPAFSQIEGMSMDGGVGQIIGHSEEHYRGTVEGLTQEQKDYLALMDDKLATIIGLDMEVILASNKLENCLKSDPEAAAESERYREALSAFRAKKEWERNTLWSEHKKLLRKAHFIDPGTLLNHVSVQTLLLFEQGSDLHSQAEGLVCTDSQPEGVAACGVELDALLLDDNAGAEKPGP